MMFNRIVQDVSNAILVVLLGFFPLFFAIVFWAKLQ